MDISIAQEAMKRSPALWAVDNKIKLQAGTFNITGREYQLELLSPVKREDAEGRPVFSSPRRVCYMKATQLGFTEIEVLKSLHGLINGLYAKGIGYYFPTNDDVLEFGKSRFNPLIQANRNAIGRFVKTVGKKGTDTASLKKINDAFLWLRGARMPRKIDEQAVSTKTSSIPLDRLVFDELDLMADTDSEFKVVGKARGRLGDSLLKEECYISNPTTPNFGIDAMFAKSDKRHWFRKCPKCQKLTTCAELYFMEDPEGCVGIGKDGRGYVRCRICSTRIPVFPGEWVPQEPSKSEYMWGYQLSQLSSVRNDPAEILREYRNPPEDNLSEVVRLRLGWPHISKSEQLTKEDVLDCCDRNNPVLSSHPGPCAMGLDCMKGKHMVIGGRTGQDRYEVFRTDIIFGQGMESWERILDICYRMNVKSAVVDIRPYEDAARHFQKIAKFKVWLCEYKETTPLGSIYNSNTGIVSVCRTEIMDATHRLVTTPGQLALPRRSDTMVEFAKQMASPFKVLEKNQKTLQQVYRYRKTNYPDHFRHCMNYFLLAASGGKVSQVRKAKRKQKKAINSYARI